MLKLIRSQKGFTLIELLVVIGILAALAGVVTLAVANFIGEGECQACVTDRHNVQTAVVAYMAQNQGSVPADMAAIDAYLLDDPKYPWTWDATSAVINEECTDAAIVGPQCADTT